MATNPTPFADSVSRDVPMRILLDGGRSLPMPCTLSYDVSDPYAVSATFTSSEGSVTWVFARDLLIAGLTEKVGTGDVKLQPVTRRGRDLLNIELSSPGGRALIEGPLDAVRRFIDASIDVLPQGFEWQHLNFDHALSQLLKDDVA